MNVSKVVLLLCLLLSLLSTAIASVQAQAPAVKALKVGMLLPLSGSYASGGVDNRQGVEAALAISKSEVPLEVVYADSKAEAVTGINEFRKLIGTDHVLAVFVMRGSVGMAVNPVSQSSGTPLLGGVGNKDFASVNKYAFQVWSKSDDEAAFLAQTLKAKKYNRVALLTVQDDWQGAVSDSFRKDYSGDGAAIVYDQEVIPSDTDFRTLLLKIKSISPEVIFANLSISQLGPFLRQARELNVTSKVYANFWVAKKEVIESAGLEVVEGVKFIEMDTDVPALREFVAKKYSSSPSGATLSGYAATLLLQQVVTQNPRISTKEDLYSDLLRQTEIRTPDGSIPIKDRCVKFPLVEKVIHDGKVETERGAR